MSIENEIFEPSSTQQSIYKEKKSKFMGFLHPVSNEEESKEVLKLYKKQFYDARHICYGYRVGVDCIVENQTDDGEPKNSAGAPILNQLKTNNITNALIVVVRYFGGVKLGVAGLINAYKTVAQQCIEKTLLSRVTCQKKFIISFEQQALNSTLQIIGINNFKILDQKFGETSKITIEVEQTDIENFFSKFETIKYMVSITEGN